MLNKKIFLYIFLFTGIIGAVHGLIAYNINAFFTWIFIGLWLNFTIKFSNKIKVTRELNSPKNTSFFLFGPLLIGLFFNFWGYYTVFWGENLLGSSIIYVSTWVLIFAYPYLLYSLYINYCCLTKFNIVYFGTKGFGARKFGLIITILWVIGGFLYIIVSNAVSDYLTGRSYFDLVFVILIIISFVLLIIYGVAGYRRPLPQITQDYIDQRRARARMLESARPIQIRPQPRPVTTTTQRSTTRRRPHSVSQTTTRRTRTITPRTTSKSTTKTKQQTKVKTSTKQAGRPKQKFNLKQMRPKAGILTIDDFRCIFCFDLPQLPKDNNRGIVVCPHCRYPAHIDEFKDWTRSSSLCSRCDSPLPANFIRNPKVIPSAVYIKGMKILLKK
ncbi:MAG: hypothetical protein ACTSR8_14560 [Promethearchaeota archaeon]